jgi:hypothetical protein
MLGEGFETQVETEEDWEICLALMKQRGWSDKLLVRVEEWGARDTRFFKP